MFVRGMCNLCLLFKVSKRIQWYDINRIRIWTGSAYSDQPAKKASNGV